jgi:serine protease Do
MRYPSRCAAILAVAFLIPFVAADEPNKNDLRRDPIVIAVEKTIKGVAAIRVKHADRDDSVGSGVIFGADGLILTNNHVCEGKVSVKVRLHDCAEYDGKVIYYDPDVDLAVVKIDAKTKLCTLKIGPGDIYLGEKVFAVGSPCGFDHTVSVGIISNRSRDIKRPDNGVVMKGLIQTSAAINPGNSGGPLINILGEVIGINVCKRMGAESIAFAINVNTVDGFLKDYYKQVSRVEHGMMLEKKVIGETGDRQAVVVKKAAESGLKQGDQIVTVAEQKIANEYEVEKALVTSKPGEKVQVRVLRDHQEVSIMLTLAASKGAGQVASASPEATTTTANVRAASQR